MTHTFTRTSVTCRACSHRLTEIRLDGQPLRWFQTATGYECRVDEGGCGDRYDLDGHRVL